MMKSGSGEPKGLVVHGQDGDTAMLRVPLLVEHLALHSSESFRASKGF